MADRRQQTILGISFMLSALLPAMAATDLDGSPKTVQEIMDAAVDPSADAIWDSVGVIEDGSGKHLRQPHDSGQWKKLEQAADKLVHGATQLAKIRAVGANGHGLLADTDTPGIRTADQIARDIANDPARFSAAAMRLRDAGLAARSAIAMRDAQKLLEAGAAMDAACEACHAAYWYPRTRPLTLPPESAFAHFPERHPAAPPRAATAD